MPRKNIREMNYFERMHYSLSAKMFNTILNFSIILSLVAVAFGFYLYSNATRNQYIEKAKALADNIGIALDKEVVGDYASRTKEIYDGLSQSVKDDINGLVYLESFSSLIDENYNDIIEELKEYCIANDAGNIIVGYQIDNNYVFIFDVNKEGLVNRPGYTQIMSEEEKSFFDSIVDSMPVILNEGRNTFSCVGSGNVLDNGEVIANVITYFSLDEVANLSRHFLLQYLLILLIVTIVVDVLIVRRMKRTVVQPILDLNNAAREYITDSDYTKMHFSELKIKSGDEIESLALIMADMEKQISKHVSNIIQITGEKEKISAELNVASQIQEGMLPNIFPAFPDHLEFEIFASMFTAKEVGGDFYDFFLVDDDHLAVVIADVSGKGVPAALFMMASKIVINNLSTIGITDPGEILQEVNKRIVKNNPVEMFVTVWLGILEISTGKLKAANAGHEYPCVCLNNNEYVMMKDKHGLVIGGFENCKYQTYEIELKPGDSFFVYTDGIPEAMNDKNELFGNERLLKALNDDPHYSVVELLENVKHRIDEFVGDAPRFDDITMLALRYFGKETNELTLKAEIGNIPTVTAFIDKKLEALNCPEKVQRQIAVAIDELFSNIAKYAYEEEGGDITIKVDTENEHLVVISFIDEGKPFNPLENKEPDINLNAEERGIGGLGVYLVKKTMDEVKYEYADNKNILTIKKGF